MEASPRPALASLLPLLLAGEQSASMAFRWLGLRRRRSQDCDRLRRALVEMAADEQRHEILLRDWQRELPPAAADPLLQQQALQFFACLASEDVGLHFARIAALDSAVCHLLGALRRAQPLQALGPLWRIACDEARHVVIARDYALALTSRSDRLAAAAETRSGLTSLLILRATALDELGLDVDRVLRRLSQPPRCLC